MTYHPVKHVPRAVVHSPFHQETHWTSSVGCWAILDADRGVPPYTPCFTLETPGATGNLSRKHVPWAVFRALSQENPCEKSNLIISQYTDTWLLDRYRPKVLVAVNARE